MATINPDTNMVVISKLLGYQKGVYFIGGCVRDLQLKKLPKDYDLYVQYSIFDEIVNLLKSIKGVVVIKEIPRYKSLHLEYQGLRFSVAALRKEFYKQNSSHPSVIFVDRLEEDLSRRDLTINALAANLKWELKDLFGGLSDLKNKKINFISNPSVKIKEDPTRIFRAVDLKCRLNFNYSKKTESSITKNVSHLYYLKTNKVKAWYENFFEHTNLKMLSEDLFKLKVILYTLPSLQLIYNHDQNTPYHDFLLHEHTIKTMIKVRDDYKGEKDFHLRMWVALLHDIGKPYCKSINKKGYNSYLGHEKVGSILAKELLYRLKFSQADTYFIIESIYNHLDSTSWLKKFDNASKKHSYPNHSL